MKAHAPKEPETALCTAYDAMPLDGLRPGETALIRRLEGGRGLVSRLATLGFTPGAEIQMVQNFGRGPLIVMVRGMRVALGRGEASKISVHKI